MVSRKGSGKKKNGKKRRLASSRTTSRRRLKMNFDDDGRLLDREVIIEPPEIPNPTEKEKEIYAALNDSFVLGDDAAKAIARFEKDVMLPRYRANDESEEEFGKEEMEVICFHLGRLHMIKAILPLYGLEAYEGEILHHFVNKAFGTGRNPDSGRPQKVFRGNDSQYLERLAMTTDNEQ